MIAGAAARSISPESGQAHRSTSSPRTQLVSGPEYHKKSSKRASLSIRTQAENSSRQNNLSDMWTDKHGLSRKVIRAKTLIASADSGTRILYVSPRVSRATVWPVLPELTAG